MQRNNVSTPSVLYKYFAFDEWAQDIFEQNRIRVIIGAPEIDPEMAVKGFLQGSLSTGNNICDH